MGAEHGCWACQRAVTDDGQGNQAEQREGDAAEKGREAEVDESRRVVVPVLLWVVVQDGGRAAWAGPQARSAAGGGSCP